MSDLMILIADLGRQEIWSLSTATAAMADKSAFVPVDAMGGGGGKDDIDIDEELFGKKVGEEQKIMRLFGKLETIAINCKVGRGKKVGQGIFFHTILHFSCIDVSRLPNCRRCITFWTIKCLSFKLSSRRRLTLSCHFGPTPRNQRGPHPLLLQRHLRQRYRYEFWMIELPDKVIKDARNLDAENFKVEGCEPWSNKLEHMKDRHC